jgi:transcriptional enhancer factor
MDHHHRSCVLPSNAPALPEPVDSIPSRVLQERSANRRHGYAEDSAWKCSSSPAENVYSARLGGYFTGNIGTQLNGEKSEAQVEYETKRLLSLLHRCEKYEKYRARQPQTAKDREQRWPDHLEEAFFRGTIMLNFNARPARTHHRRLGTMAAHGSSETHARRAASRSK